MKYIVREVDGLRRANIFASDFKPKKVKGLKAKGLAYERRVGRWLMANYDGAERADWISYFDNNGIGKAQPDFLIKRPDFILCLEVKLKENTTGYTQLEKLYIPLLKHIYRKPIYGMLICAHYSMRDTKSISVEKMLANPRVGRYCYSPDLEGFDARIRKDE